LLSLLYFQVVIGTREASTLIFQTITVDQEGFGDEYKTLTLHYVTGSVKLVRWFKMVTSWSEHPFLMKVKRNLSKEVFCISRHRKTFPVTCKTGLSSPRFIFYPKTISRPKSASITQYHFSCPKSKLLINDY